MGQESESKARQLKMFLCHSSADKTAVRELYRRLRVQGGDPWLDEEKLLAGQDWGLEIIAAVRSADVVIVCLSRSSITKEGFVQKEIRHALDVADEKPDGTIFIIPVRLEECSVPDRLQKWQWIDLFDERGFGKLMTALKYRAHALGIKFEPREIAIGEQITLTKGSPVVLNKKDWVKEVKILRDPPKGSK